MILSLWSYAICVTLNQIMNAELERVFSANFQEFKLTFADLTLFLSQGTQMVKLSEKLTKKPASCRLSLDLKTLQLIRQTDSKAKTGKSIYLCTYDSSGCVTNKGNKSWPKYKRVRSARQKTGSGRKIIYHYILHSYWLQDARIK